MPTGYPLLLPFTHLPALSMQAHYQIDIIMSPIFTGEEVGPREVKQFSCGHTASTRTVGLRGALLSSDWMRSREGEPASLQEKGKWIISTGVR